MGQLQPHYSTGGFPSPSGQGAPAPLPAVSGGTLSRTSHWCTSRESRVCGGNCWVNYRVSCAVLHHSFAHAAQGGAKNTTYAVRGITTSCETLQAVCTTFVSSLPATSCHINCRTGELCAHRAAGCLCCLFFRVCQAPDNILFPDLLQGLDIIQSFVRGDNWRRKQPGVVHKSWWMSYIQLCWTVSQAAWAALQYSLGCRNTHTAVINWSAALFACLFVWRWAFFML